MAFQRAAGFLTLMLVWFAVFDWQAGISLSVPVVAFFLLLGVWVGRAWTREAAPARRLGLLWVFSLSIILMRWVDWDSLKPFMRDFRSIETGMERSELAKRLEKYSQDAKHNYGRNNVDVYRHSAEGWGSGVVGIVYFRGDHVQKVSIHFE